MKTLFSTYNEAQGKEKRLEYERIYNVKFTCYHTGNGIVILPVLNWKTTIEDNKNVKLIYDHISNDPLHGINFAKLMDLTGLEIKEVLEACKWLIKNQYCNGDVCRQGFLVGLHVNRIKREIK
jgi:hypothetical protein